MRAKLKYRRRILLLGLTLVLAGLALFVLLREAEHRQMRAFAAHYAKLHGQRDVEGMLELFYWQDVPTHHRSRLQLALQAETRYPLERVQVARTSAKSLTEAFKNTAIELNLSPRWRMEAVLATEDRLGSAYWVGRTDEGQLHIASARNPE